MMRRALPLLIDVLMAASAGIGFHEVIRGDVLAVGRLRGTGKEGAVWAVAFAIHGCWRNLWILNLMRVLPRDRAQPPGPSRDQRRDGQAQRAAQQPRSDSDRKEASLRRPAGDQKRAAGQARADMRIKQRPFHAPRASVDQYSAENSSHRKK